MTYLFMGKVTVPITDLVRDFNDVWSAHNERTNVTDVFFDVILKKGSLAGILWTASEGKWNSAITLRRSTSLRWTFGSDRASVDRVCLFVCYLLLLFFWFGRTKSDTHLSSKWGWEGVCVHESRMDGWMQQILKRVKRSGWWRLVTECERWTHNDRVCVSWCRRLTCLLNTEPSLTRQEIGQSRGRNVMKMKAGTSTLKNMKDEKTFWNVKHEIGKWERKESNFDCVGRSNTHTHTQSRIRCVSLVFCCFRNNEEMVSIRIHFLIRFSLWKS